MDGVGFQMCMRDIGYQQLLLLHSENTLSGLRGNQISSLVLEHSTALLAGCSHDNPMFGLLESGKAAQSFFLLLSLEVEIHACDQPVICQTQGQES